MFIGEKPGQEEAYRGCVFVGDTGRESDNLYLPLAGLGRPEVYMTNCVKCRLGSNNVKPTPQQVEQCARHWLPQEVADCNPKVIVLLGSTACSLVPKIELEKEHGYPVKVKQADHGGFFGAWEGTLFPMYHPAAGLHETGMMIPLIDDFERLKKWLSGKWAPPEPPDIEPDYALVESTNDFTAYVDCVEAVIENALDTENDGADPHSIQISHTPWTARMILASNRRLVRVFKEWAYYCSTGWILHHRIHDEEVLDRLDLRLADKADGMGPVTIRDTMQEAYQLGNLPQGLKALAYRLLGIRMRSWEDVVTPYSREKMIAWLTEQWDEASDHREGVEKQLKTKVKVMYKPTGRERDIKRILSHAHKPEYDLWRKAEEAGLEGFPIRSIAHVPLKEAVEYACQDVDVTGQVGAVLEQMRRGIVKKEWKVSEEDRDQ